MTFAVIWHYINKTELNQTPVIRSGADNRGEPGEQDASSMEQQVAAFLQSKGTEVDCESIEACHPLPRGDDSDKPAIIIRFLKKKTQNCTF